MAAFAQVEVVASAWKGAVQERSASLRALPCSVHVCSACSSRPSRRLKQGAKSCCHGSTAAERPVHGRRDAIRDSVGCAFSHRDSSLPRASLAEAVPAEVESPSGDASTKEYDAVVIGSGIGGIVAACQLAIRGAKVLLLEKYIIPGGSSGYFERDGYVFDVGSSVMFGFGDKVRLRAFPVHFFRVAEFQALQ